MARSLYDRLLGKRQMDMTEGKILKQIFTFALPILFGQLLGVIYSYADAWVVGNYVSDEAYSAIGTVSPIISLLLNSFNGLATGLSIIVAQCYGAKDREKMQKQMEESQKALEEKEFSASAGGGAVEVKASGKKEIISVKLKEEVVDPDDIEMLEDLIVAALQEGFDLIDKETQEAMGPYAGMLGGLN